MRVVEVKSTELPVSETVQALADYVEDQARSLWDASAGGSEAGKRCAADYFVVCMAFARRIRAAAERLDDDVLSHLEGPCKAH